MERFDVYVDRRLYGADGFYTTGGGAGRCGDFITSPEVGPLFGLLLSRLVDMWWHELGRPGRFEVYDVGTGPGTLVKSLLAADPDCAGVWQVTGVDRAGPAVQKALPEDLSGSVIIANELFDNMACRIVERQKDNSWREVYVDSADSTRPDKLAEVEAPGFDLPIGLRAPWHEQAQVWLEDVLGRGAARVLVLDYGAATTAELAERGDWLRTYAGHQRNNNPYAPGSFDITCDVGFDQFRAPSQLTTQTDLLESLGIAQLVAEGRRIWEANAARPNLDALQMRSRVSEAEALCDQAGLGSWQAAVWAAD